MCTSFTWCLFKFFLCKIVPRQQPNASLLTRITARYQNCQMTNQNFVQLSLFQLNLFLIDKKNPTDYTLRGFWDLKKITIQKILVGGTSLKTQLIQ